MISFRLTFYLAFWAVTIFFYFWFFRSSNISLITFVLLFVYFFFSHLLFIFLLNHALVSFLLIPVLNIFCVQFLVLFFCSIYYFCILVNNLVFFLCQYVSSTCHQQLFLVIGFSLLASSYYLNCEIQNRYFLLICWKS